MRILINTTNLIAGGGIQVAISFIRECYDIEENIYDVFLTDRIYEQIKEDIKYKHVNFHLISRSPASLKSRKEICKEMSAIENEIQPDCVFTVFGPSYWKPKVPHICGFALPWIINPENPIHAKIGFAERIKNWLIKKYKWYHFSKEVDYLWCETEDVKERINKIFGFSKDNISVIGNTYGKHFKDYLSLNTNIEKNNNSKCFRMVTISAYYPHKNIEIIKDIIPILKERIEFQFVLTLPQEIFLKIFSAEEQKYINNIGPISSVKCPEIYASVDAMFLPTMLECFSANYPEAMVMGKPILTSNYSFAKDICMDAAEFFDPQDPVDVVEKILRIATDNDRYKDLVDKGKKRVINFPSSKDRAEQFIEICKDVVVKKN